MCMGCGGFKFKLGKKLKYTIEEEKFLKAKLPKFLKKKLEKIKKEIWNMKGKADVIFKGGNIYTMDLGNPKV